MAKIMIPDKNYGAIVLNQAIPLFFQGENGFSCCPIHAGNENSLPERQK
jgi:hypothetical protein